MRLSNFVANKLVYLAMRYIQLSSQCIIYKQYPVSTVHMHDHHINFHKVTKGLAFNTEHAQ